MYRVGAPSEPVGGAKPAVAFVASGIVNAAAAVKADKYEAEVEADSKAPVKAYSFQRFPVESEISSHRFFIIGDTGPRKVPDIACIGKNGPFNFPEYGETVFYVGFQFHFSNGTGYGE